MSTSYGALIYGANIYSGPNPVDSPSVTVSAVSGPVAKGSLSFSLSATVSCVTVTYSYGVLSLGTKATVSAACGATSAAALTATAKSTLPATSGVTAAAVKIGVKYGNATIPAVFSPTVKGAVLLSASAVFTAVNYVTAYGQRIASASANIPSAVSVFSSGSCELYVKAEATTYGVVTVKGQLLASLKAQIDSTSIATAYGNITAAANTHAFVYGAVSLDAFIGKAWLPYESGDIGWVMEQIDSGFGTLTYGYYLYGTSRPLVDYGNTWVAEETPPHTWS